ncbi:hypothetical protein ACF1DW_04225 [Streptomyces sp. NPDC014603]|uniref:hypothetical protein n=1 Tax=Streptomyces sp. NPDC014603 TaxID=3364873 RepID=UPI0036F5AB7C
MNVERGSDHQLTRARDTTREQRVAASRVVLRKARNPKDLRLLLDALGLNDPPRT